MDKKNLILFLGLLLIIILILYFFLSRKKSLKISPNSSPSLKPTSIMVNRNKIIPTFSKPIMPTISVTNTSSVNVDKNLNENKNVNRDKDVNEGKNVNEDKNKFYSDKIFPKLTLFNQSEILKFENLISQTPIYETNYSVFYSPLLNKVYFKPKNKQGEKDIKEFIRNYQLENLIKKFPQNFIIDQDLNEEKIRAEETNFLENQQKNPSFNNTFNSNDYFNQNLPQPSMSNLTPQISPLSEQESKNNSFDFLVDLLRILLNDYSSEGTKDVTLTDTYLTSTPSSPFPQSRTISSLRELFDDVGRRVGVPPKILEGVMTIEMASTFRLSSQEIVRYSQPGNRIPGCGPNHCSATGPMQMTIGIDNNGSSRCSKCGLTSCPNAWASYGKAVNIFTNDSHTPDPCNLRDNVFAAAYKLKTDSGATNPIYWNQEQVYKAARRYYGSCADKYRLGSYYGNRTYCEFLWWYYTNK